MNLVKKSTHQFRSVCPYCGVGCGIVLETDGTTIIKVSGDKQHSANKGRLCTKGNTCAEAINQPGRLVQAYVRSDRQHAVMPTNLQVAIAHTAQRLTAIITEHGADALAFYVSGQLSMEAQYLANKLAKGFVRTRYMESNSRLCMASAGSGYKLSLGADAPPGSYDDFEHAEVFFVMGANMADCHPILYLRMMDRVKAGAKLIVVDPRRNATADKAHLFLHIKPGTDLALLNGLLHLLVKNKYIDEAFITEFTEGWQQMPTFLPEYTPESVANITGLSVADICLTADLIGQANAWMSCWTQGLNQSIHGTWNTNAVCNLHLATGKICRLGSGPFSLTGQPNAMAGREMGYMGPGLPGQRSLLVDEDRAFTENMWGLQPGTLRTESSGGSVALFERMAAGDIKACWIICTNPVASMANRDTVIAGLQAAELVITQDVFFDTETNRYADVMLPGALWAEAEGVMVNSERTLTLMQRAVAPPGEAMADWQIIAQVACAMGYAHAFSYASASDVFDEIKRTSNPKTGYDLRGISYDRLRQTPVQWPCASSDASERNPIRYVNDGVSQRHKVHANSQSPRLVFATDSGRAVFYARPYLPPAEMPDMDFPWVFNNGRLQHQWHTMTKTGKIAKLNKLNPSPFVEIHPEDALVLGISDQDTVEVRSRRGRVVLPAVVSDKVRQGTCFAPIHWNDVYGKDLCINALTNDAVDPISQQPEFKFCAVALTRVATVVAQSVVQPAAHEDTAHEDTMEPIDALTRLMGLDTAPTMILNDTERLYLQGFLAALRTDAARLQLGVPVLPVSAPISPTSRFWVDGMLAGLYSRCAVPEGVAVGASVIETQDESITHPVNLLTVLWASQTGNTEAFAQQCAAKLKHAGHGVTLLEMSRCRPTELAAMRRVLLLTSTFGDGDPPDNGVAFWQALQSEQASQLDGVEYAVLAFGDSNYDQFCGFARRLDTRMAALGAEALMDRVECEPDDEDKAHAWMADIVAVMANFMATVSTDEAVIDRVQSSSVEVRYSRQHPLYAPLVLNRVLNAPGGGKETRQIGFDLTDSGLQYQAGDALGVWPKNSPALVDELLSVMHLAADMPVVVNHQGDMAVVNALKHHYDITRVSTELLRWLSERAGDAILVERLQEGNKTALKQWLYGKQLVDVLAEYPVRATAHDWLAVLKRIQPRLYSISSSAKANPNQVQLTVATVRYDYRGKMRGGVCSTYLADHAKQEDVAIFVQPSAHFHPPADPATPIIMVGPGTGVAPFRAFLQERQATAATGKNWLFFGEQHSAMDFYYKDEFEKFKVDGYLHRLDTAFSRDQADKIYVQHRIIEHGAQLWAWLQQGAGMYVCGDASHMAKDVDHALKQVVQQHGAMTAERAVDYVNSLAQAQRYVRDVY